MKRLPRVYAILDLETCQGRGIDPVFLARLWCDVGIRLIQLRSKATSTRKTFEFCRRVAIAVAGYPHVRLLVNDRVDIAMALGIDGVHLPSDGLPIENARALVNDALIAVSCHNDDEVKVANKKGASFVTLSPIFTPKSKPEDTRETLGFEALRALNTIPVFALGGLDAERGSRAIEEGAYGVAFLGELTRTEIPADLVTLIQKLNHQT